MTSTVLNSAFASLSLVYQAYVKIKTNKERCAQLVDRCQLVVHRLQAIIDKNGDVAVQDRVRDLELAFQQAARIISEVGQQGILVSLLRSDENALKIEDCQHALSELVSLLNLHQVIDVSTWQRENEAARKRDHAELLRIGRRLEDGNAAIIRELSQQGATLGQVSRIVQALSSNLSDTNSPPPLYSSAIDDGVLLEPSPPRPRSFSAPNSLGPYTSASSESALSDTSDDSTSVAGNLPDHPPRPRSWSNLLRLTPLTSVMSRLAPRNSGPTTSLDESQHAIPQVTPHAVLENPLEESLNIPPPVYDAVVKQNSRKQDEETLSNPDSESMNTDASNETVRADDSPVPSSSSSEYLDMQIPPSVYSDTRPPKSPGSSLKTEFRPKSSAMRERTVRFTSDVDHQINVEFRILANTINTSKPVPLDSFAHVERNHLDLVKCKVDGISKTLKPMLQRPDGRPVYKKFFLLCPVNSIPHLVITKDKMAAPQATTKAYILQTLDKQTLVAVKDRADVRWVLIPYAPETRIWEAKRQIGRHFNPDVVVSCRLKGRTNDLDDDQRFVDCGIRPYEHDINMTLST